MAGISENYKTVSWTGWIDEDRESGIKEHKTGYFMRSRTSYDGNFVRFENYSHLEHGWLDNIFLNDAGILVIFNGEVFCPPYRGMLHNQVMYSNSKRWYWKYIKDNDNHYIEFGDKKNNRHKKVEINLNFNGVYYIGFDEERSWLELNSITFKNFRLEEPPVGFYNGTIYNGQWNGSPGDPKRSAELFIEAGASTTVSSCPNLLISSIEIKMVSDYYTTRDDSRVTNTDLFSSGYGTSDYIITQLEDGDITPKDNDPYNPESNDPPDGEGDYDWGSDEIPVPDDPNYSVIASGFVTLFKPYLTELQSLSRYMWSDAFSLDSFKKLLADPMDAIIGLTVIPVDAPTAGRKAVSVAGISTDTSMGYVTDEWVTVECGTLNLTNKYGSYLDYAGLSKLTLFLPYIGARDLNIDDVMGRSIGVTYKVNVLTGECIAFVVCVMTDGNKSVLYEFNGQCGRNVALTASNFASLYSSTIQLVGSAAAAASGDVLGGVTSAVNATMGSKPDIEMSGNISGVAGHMGIQKPYLILHQPNQAVATRQNSFTGYPAFKTVNLTQGQGYTIIKDIHFKNFPGNDDELQELLSLLKGGVIL